MLVSKRVPQRGVGAARTWRMRSKLADINFLASTADGQHGNSALAVSRHNSELASS